MELELKDWSSTRAIFARAVLDKIYNDSDSSGEVHLRLLQDTGMAACAKLGHPIKTITASGYCRELLALEVCRTRRLRKKNYYRLNMEFEKEIVDLLDSDWGKEYVLWRDKEFEDSPVMDDLLDRVPFRMTSENRLPRDEWRALMSAFSAGKVDLRVVWPREQR